MPPFQRPPRPLSAAASALAAAALALAVAGCSHIAPLGPDPSPVSLPPTAPLGSPITMQVMRSQQPNAAGQCPAGSVDLFGSDPTVPRASTSVQVQPAHTALTQGSSPAPAAAPATTPAPTAGVACYVPVGGTVTITSAAVSSVTTDRNQQPAWYVFEVAFPTADVAALTALIRQAYAAGDSLGISVAGKLWQAPQPRSKVNALRAQQIILLSRNQALQLYRLLVPSG